MANSNNFLVVMAWGRILGIIYSRLNYAVLGIALSVFVLGAAIATNINIYNNLIYFLLLYFPLLQTLTRGSSISYLMVLCCWIYD